MTSREQGFTLVELLVTMTVLATLVAIALPSFASRRDNAFDASAKRVAARADFAMQAYAVEHGTYDARRQDLLALAPDLVEGTWTLESTPNSYSLTALADSGDAFTIQRRLGGLPVRTCTEAGAGGCAADGTW